MLSNAAILDAIDAMSVEQLDALRDGFVAKFRVVCPTPVVPVVVEPVVVAQEEFAVWLVTSGPGKINVIKLVRELLGLGLKESKELVDRAPVELRTGLPKDAAEQLVAKLVDARATAELR